MNVKLARVAGTSALVLATATMALVATACSAGSDSTSSKANSTSSNSASKSDNTASPGKGTASASSGTSGSGTSSKGSDVVVSSPGAAGAKSAGKTACTGAELKPSIVHGTDADPDPKAGQTQATLLFTNVGKRTCTVQGHPGVDLVDSSGKSWSLMWQKATAAKISLKPGTATMADLTFVPVSPNSTASEQKPFKVANVKVTPPDTTATATLAWPWPSIAVQLQDGATHPGTYIGPVFGTAN
ncbi:DUF4232 domain-containing protein [Streptomyces sp. YIM S03343]